MKLMVNGDTKNLNSVLDEENLKEKLEQENRFDKLQTELNQLSVIDKALISLLLEGLSMKDIADVIGITEPNVKVKIHRIKAQLKQKLKKETIMKTKNKNNNISDLEPLVKKLKKEDTNYASVVKAIQIIYWIFIPLFTVMTIREYTDTKNINDIISGVCFILSFLIIALFFKENTTKNTNLLTIRFPLFKC